MFSFLSLGFFIIKSGSKTYISVLHALSKETLNVYTTNAGTKSEVKIAGKRKFPLNLRIFLINCISIKIGGL